MKRSLRTVSSCQRANEKLSFALIAKTVKQEFIVDLIHFVQDICTGEYNRIIRKHGGEIL